MNKLVCGVAALTLAISTPSAAQLGGCSQPPGPLLKALIDTASRLYPRAVATDTSASFATVALILDTNCAIIQRASGNRRGRRTVDSVLALLIPQAMPFQWSISGIAQLRPITEAESERFRGLRDSSRNVGEPWLVWAVQRTAKR